MPVLFCPKGKERKESGGKQTHTIMLPLQLPLMLLLLHDLSPEQEDLRGGC